MKSLGVLLLVALLTGCGSTGLTGEPERTGYILVSEGKAGFVQRMFGANVRYCKATQHNLAGVDFVGEIGFKEDSCNVQITAESSVD